MLACGALLDCPVGRHNPCLWVTHTEVLGIVTLILNFPQAYPPIKLKRSQLRLDRMAAKVVVGVGSAAKSARRIVSRIGSNVDGPAQPQVPFTDIYTTCSPRGLFRMTGSKFSCMVSRSYAGQA